MCCLHTVTNQEQKTEGQVCVQEGELQSANLSSCSAGALQALAQVGSHCQPDTGNTPSGECDSLTPHIASPWHVAWLSEYAEQKGLLDSFSHLFTCFKDIIFSQCFKIIPVFNIIQKHFLSPFY